MQALDIAIPTFENGPNQCLILGGEFKTLLLENGSVRDKKQHWFIVDGWSNISSLLIDDLRGFLALWKWKIETRRNKERKHTKYMGSQIHRWRTADIADLDLIYSESINRPSQTTAVEAAKAVLDDIVLNDGWIGWWIWLVMYVQAIWTQALNFTFVAIDWHLKMKSQYNCVRRQCKFERFL